MRAIDIADLFELVTNAIPDRLAPVAGERRMTYRESRATNKQVNQ